MKSTKTFTVLGAMLVLASLFLLHAQTSYAQTRENGRATRYVVVAKEGVYIRNKASGFVLGTLYNGDHFDVQYARGAYAWGYAHGDYKGCGWVLLKDERHVFLKPIEKSGNRRAACSPHREIRFFDEFGSDKNSITCPDGRQSRCDVSHAKLQRGTTLYGNYRNGRHIERGSKHLPVNTSIGWRYITKDKKYVVIRTAGGQWGFVEEDDVKDRQDDTDCSKRESCKK